MYDILVLGAGSAGASVALEAARRGYRVLAVDQGASPDFSSVRNQGWLHSGFLYAGTGASSVAEECRDASHEIRELLSAAKRLDLLSEKKGVAFFTTEQRAQLWAGLASESQIFAQQLTRSEVNNLVDSAGMPKNHSAAVLIDDCAIKNSSFLNFLLSKGRELGVEVCCCPSLLQSAKIARLSEGWQLTAGDQSFEAKKIVVCLGPATPSFLNRTLGSTLNFVLRNCYVLAIQGIPLDRLLISPNAETRSLNLAPFENGITVNCGATDEHNEDFNFSEVAGSRRQTLHWQLKSVWPQLLRNPNLRAFHYVCQKLEYRDIEPSEKRRFVIRSVADGILSFYPGKFTLSLLGAREALNILERGKPIAPNPSRTPISTDHLFDFQHPGSKDSPSLLSELARG